MTREEKILEARRLRAEGWTAPAIGQHLDVSESTIRNWYLGADCLDCGTPITYDTAHNRPTRCPSCERKRVASEHGSRWKYSTGCRCDACRATHRTYMREYMRDRRALQARGAAA